MRSIIPIIPGVESTLTPIVPPTSVTRRSSTVELVAALDPGLERASLTSDHPQAAADAERLAGDVGGVVGGEEGDRGGDLVGLAEAAAAGSPAFIVSMIFSPISPNSLARPSAAASRSGPGAIALAVIP